MEFNKSHLKRNSGSFLFNPFAAKFPIMEKPGNWFILPKCMKNTLMFKIKSFSYSLVFFTYFTNSDLVPGFSIIRKLAANG